MSQGLSGVLQDADASFAGLSEIAVVDVETTGFSPVTDRVVAVAVIRADLSSLVAAEVSGGTELDVSCETLDLLVDPGRSIPAEASVVHGIRDEDVRGRRSFAQVAGSLRDFVGDRLLIAHNASFDRRFLEAEFGRAGMAGALCDNDWRCTMRRFQRERRPAHVRTNLAAAAAWLGVRGRSGRLHAALEDARITFEIACVFYLRDAGLRQRRKPAVLEVV